jgi:hypothetical protein
MVDVETLADLLRDAVAPFPLARRLSLILPEKIAHTVGCHRRTLDREIERGRISVIRAAGKTYISKDAAIAWWKRSQHPRQCRTIHHTAADSSSGAYPRRRKNSGHAQSSARTLTSRKASR